MIYTDLKCNTCNEFLLIQERDEIDQNEEKKEESILKGTVECKHFEISLAIFIENKNLKEYQIFISCKNCLDNRNEKFIDENKIFTYCCNNCKKGSIYFFYEFTKANNKRYITPESPIIDNKEKIKIKFIYNNNKFSIYVSKKNLVKKYYDIIRDKLKFPNGKKILYNNEPINLNKTFEENKIIYNDMELEIDISP